MQHHPSQGNQAVKWKWRQLLAVTLRYPRRNHTRVNQCFPATAWEAWFSQRLRNRIFYFFHRHDKAGRIVRCVGEWPLPLPERPVSPGARAEDGEVIDSAA